MLRADDHGLPTTRTGTPRAPAGDDAFSPAQRAVVDGIDRSSARLASVCFWIAVGVAVVVLVVLLLLP